VGFTDDDFFLADEPGDENYGVVAQIAGEADRFRNSSSQALVPTTGHFRLNITRQDGLLIPIGNDAGIDNPRQQAQQVEVQTASEPIEGAVFPDLAQQQEQGLEKDLLVVNEDTLNTFSYYRRLDRRLSFEQFRSRTLSIPPPAIGDEGLGEKGFREKYGVNPFVATSRDHLSTFGMDVDNASWGRARESLMNGQLPAADIVRVEEFVNSFSDERPGNPDSVFTVFTEGGPSPFGGSELELLQITIKSRDLLPAERKNAVLTFAVDTSGSMASQGKLELLQESLKALVANLGPNDRVAIVAFSTNAFVVLPHTSVRQHAHIEAAIDSLSPDGGTNVEAGINLAYRLAGESHDRKAANRVLLCSDGVANLGAKGPEAILERIRRFAEGNLVSLFTYAFGTGGRQAVQGDRMLQRLADEGDGRYQYVDSSQGGLDLFSLPDQLQFLASDAKIQVDFNPAVISHYRLLGYEKRDIADVDFRNDKIDAGEVGPGSTVTAIYEIKRARPIGSLGRLHLRYRDETSRRFEEFDYDLPTGVLAGRLEDTTDRFRFIAAISEFAEILRQSYYARDASYGSILEVMASNSPPYRARAGWREARELITKAQGLSAIEALQALEAQELFSP
jgi:Ca-activated chloride channel family protein